jgi:hypothetical protein
VPPCWGELETVSLYVAGGAGGAGVIESSSDADCTSWPDVPTTLIWYVPGVMELDVLRRSTESKLAVPAGGVNELNTPAGTPEALRPTGFRTPLSRTTETVIWASPPATTETPTGERTMWKLKGLVVDAVVDAAAVDLVVAEAKAVLVEVEVKDVDVLTLVLVAVEVDAEDEEEDDEEEVDKKVEVDVVTVELLVFVAVEVDEYDDDEDSELDEVTVELEVLVEVNTAPGEIVIVTGSFPTK